MPTLLRWTVRGVLGLLAFLLFETGVIGLPEALGDQVALVNSFGGEWIIRLAALVLGTIVALVTVGPTRLQAWANALSDWWHSDARQIKRLQEDNERLTTERNALKVKLETYESHDAPKVLAKIDEKGPVVFDKAEWSYGGVSVPVPYKAQDAPVVIEVGDANDTYSVTLAYEVRSAGELRYQFEPTINIWTRLEVLDEDGEKVRDQIVHKGVDNVHKHAHTGELLSWWYVVSRSLTLSGLPKGTYGLKVWDTTDGRSGREYRNMHLVVAKLG